MLGPHAHPQVSMHTHSLADYVACLEAGDLTGVADLMLSSASKLEAAGADLLICPDNTIHQAWPAVAGKSPLPWLHIADVVAADAARRGFARVALLGTRWLMESEVYQPRLAQVGIRCDVPDPAERSRIGGIIMDELVIGRFEPESIAYFQAVIGRMRADGCDAVVLGCTEIPLVLNDGNSPLPTLDSTRLLARAALAAAIGGP